MIPLLADTAADAAAAGAFISDVFSFLVGLFLFIAIICIWINVSGINYQLKKLNKQFETFFTFYALKKPPEKPTVEDVIL